MYWCGGEDQLGGKLLYTAAANLLMPLTSY
jgi:hypothetical protein